MAGYVMQRSKVVIRPKLAVVVPVYGNEGSLLELYQRIVAAVSGLGLELVLQFVNDRSPDGSQAVLEAIAREDSRVRVMLLSRNHGSFTAIAAGLARTAECDAAVILSADLQDPPEMIPAMVAAWRKGRKTVLCARRRRDDPGLTRVFATVFHWVYRKAVMPEMPSGGFDFCLIDRCVVRVILQSAEKKTSLVGLILWAGFDRKVLYYERAARKHGRSMWTFGKKLSYAFHSVVAFSSFPLRMFAFLGVLTLAGCGLVACYIVIASLLGVITVPGWASMVLLQCASLAVMFLGFGILGGYLWINLEQTRKRPLFIVDREIGGSGAGKQLRICERAKEYERPTRPKPHRRVVKVLPHLLRRRKAQR